jgi:hypothetical protein
MPHFLEKKSYLGISIWFFYMVCFSFGCLKLTDVNGPAGVVTGEQAFSNESSSDASVVGTYNKAARESNILNGAITYLPAVYADELRYLGSDVPIQQFYFNSINTGNKIISSNFWAASYSMIYNINKCLEGLNKSSTLTDDFKKSRMAECKFLRGLIYFNLTQLFGEVPLILVTDVNSNKTLGRTKISEINTNIVTDLEEAQNNLPESYISTERIRPNKWAATALLARFYLYQRDWETAYNLATRVIESGMYRLPAGLDSVFLRNSTEAILQLQPIQAGYNSMDASLFIPAASAAPSYCLTDSLIKSFDPSDKRFKHWVGVTRVNGTNYYYPYKFKIIPANSAGFRPVEYNTMIRLAEMYLIRAESALAQHRVANAVADVDIIRKRAGLPSVLQGNPDISETELSDTIQKERRLEFFAEWGHRWFDLRRTGKANDVLKYKPGWQPADTLWPIPVSEILKNLSLTQNPGYW